MVHRIFIIVLHVLIFFSQTMAQQSFEDSLKNILKDLPDSLSIRHLNNISWSLRETDPGNALKFGKQSLEIAQTKGFPKEEAQVLNYLGVIYRNLNDYSTALEYFFKALALSEDFNITIENAYALNNIGDILQIRGDYPQALNYTKRSLQLQLKMNNKRGIAYSYIRLSEIYYNQKQYDSLYFAAQTAFSIRQELKDEVGSFVAMKFIAMSHEGKGQYIKALDYYQSILKHDSLYIYANEGVTRTYLQMKKPEKAIVFGLRRLELKKNQPALIKYVSDAYAMTGQWKFALQYNILAQKYNDSIAVQEKYILTKNLKILHEIKIIEEENAILRTKDKIYQIMLICAFVAFILMIILMIVFYKNRKKEKYNNLLLNRKNEKIMTQRDQLKELNDTKDKFFSIISHDLRGPIGTVSSFLDFISGTMDSINKEELTEYIQELKKVSKTTFELLENLLVWSMSQRGYIEYKPTLNDINKIAQTNASLISHIAESKRITIINEINKSIKCIFDYNMINTVFRNLLNNAVKYTHENGQVRISAFNTPSEIEISISDTGIGIKNETLQNLFKIDLKQSSILGTNGEKGSGLGLILCKEFIVRHGGKIWVESEPGKGSSFKFTLPRIENNNQKKGKKAVKIKNE